VRAIAFLFEGRKRGNTSIGGRRGWREIATMGEEKEGEGSPAHSILDVMKKEKKKTSQERGEIRTSLSYSVIRTLQAWKKRKMSGLHHLSKRS